MRETIVPLIQVSTDVGYISPWCRQRIIQDFDYFLDKQRLSWSDFPDWKFEED